MAVKVYTWIEPESQELWGKFEGFYQLYEDDPSQPIVGIDRKAIEDMVESQQIRNMDDPDPVLCGGIWEMPRNITTVKDAEKAAAAIGQIILDAYYRDLKEASDG